MEKRFALIRKYMKIAGVQAFLVRKPENIFYLSGLETSQASIIITSRNAILIVDSRYYQKAKKTASIEAFLLETKFENYLNEYISEKKISSIAVESNYLSAKQFQKIKKQVKAKIALDDEWVEKVRQVKNVKEISLVKNAIKIADKTMAFAKHSLSHGITEIELAKKIECFIRQSGARSEAFETIVASGPNAAMPHHTSTNRHIKAGDTVVIDLGVKVNNYNSDITRTFLVQPVSELTKKLYLTCLEAQKKAIDMLKKGILVSELDKSARSIIDKVYPNKFGHSLGHGIGLEVHEMPNIGSGNQEKLEENMVFTVEPGIYLENKMGVRIEDIVQVGASGAKVLTKSPKKLEDAIVEL